MARQRVVEMPFPERVREHFGEMHGCPQHHRGVEIVRTQNDVDLLLNNNRIAAGIITAAH
jgi:hypothetical protein